MRIRDKVVLITGASQGIGAACAQVFRQRGAKLSLVARSQQGLDRAAAGTALTTAGDLRDEVVRRRAVERTLDQYGRLDILINNAGCGLYGPTWRTSLDQVRAMFDLNLFALLGMIQLAVPAMQAQGSGALVNVGSIAGKVTLPWLTAYSASKHAVQALSDGLRMELKQDGIHVMTVCPGYVETDFQRNVLAGAPPEPVKRSRMMKISPLECAEAIARGVERNARTVLTPVSGWGFVAAHRLATPIVEGRMARLNQVPAGEGA